MRYILSILLIGAAIGAAAFGMLGLQGKMSRKPPLEIFPDMKRQPKLRPQKPSAFAEAHRTSRLPVPGTVPVGARSQSPPCVLPARGGPEPFAM